MHINSRELYMYICTYTHTHTLLTQKKEKWNGVNLS